MAAPYTSNPSVWQTEMRSVTPATNNARLAGRYTSASRPPAHASDVGASHRYPSPYQRSNDVSSEPHTPSSTGLIRLTLKKPMGIVFEPMYDPNQPSNQRGVRICDLPRTGAAALSRRLQVGDELLQINDTTVSRMKFDEIMDFIIDADPENVNLLFRRPRKETLQARQGLQLNASSNKDNPSTVKWVDEETGEKKGKERKESSKKTSKRLSKRTKKGSVSEEEETVQSSTGGEDSYDKSRRKKHRNRSNFQEDSFLDMLIDSLCHNSSNVCRDTFRKHDDFSDDESLASDLDEETYSTYDESVEQKRKGKKGKKSMESLKEKPKRSLRKDDSITKTETKKYEDDGTLETVETRDQQKPVNKNAPPEQPLTVDDVSRPLGLAPPAPEPVSHEPPSTGILTKDEPTNQAPIKEVEYDDRFDHAADVSVMESLGGPSLLIEKQRAAAQAALRIAHTMPVDIMDSFDQAYPPKYGMTREQAIQNDPLVFYTHVVQKLLEKHEPGKARLLDKLLAKYRGREDHLIQKLSVRYNRDDEADPVDFTEAVTRSKSSSNTAAVINLAKDRMQTRTRQHPEMFDWPEKEQKEPDLEDENHSQESASDFSRDSVDGTSPAVIAQVSELLNYVYGKTSVPGQIDRVSTIMRAYEGREAVLLELLETKALIKANKEKENADNLPSFLRQTRSSQAQRNVDEIESTDLPPVTPMATQEQRMPDDMSSMSGVSSPAFVGDSNGDRILAVRDSNIADGSHF